MNQPGKVASPTRGQLNRENVFFPISDRALEFGLARRVRASIPAYSAYSRDSSRFPRQRLFIHTAIRHRISPQFIGSRNCVWVAFTAVGPQAQIGPVNLKVVPVTGAAFASPWTN